MPQMRLYCPQMFTRTRQRLRAPAVFQDEDVKDLEELPPTSAVHHQRESNSSCAIGIGRQDRQRFDDAERRLVGLCEARRLGGKK
jgi:hypothetical protein